MCVLLCFTQAVCEVNTRSPWQWTDKTGETGRDSLSAQWRWHVDSRQLFLGMAVGFPHLVRSRQLVTPTTSTPEYVAAPITATHRPGFINHKKYGTLWIVCLKVSGRCSTEKRVQLVINCGLRLFMITNPASEDFNLRGSQPQTDSRLLDW